MASPPTSIDPATEDDVAALFDRFVALDDVQQVLTTFRQLCHILDVRPSSLPNFLQQLKNQFVVYPKAKKMIDDLYMVAEQKGCIRNDSKSQGNIMEGGYVTNAGPNCCANRNILIVGGGPCGLRMAVEARFMGARVIVLEKRTNFTRYNIAHLWKQAVIDLQSLKPRHFCQDLCSGSHDTISIRQLQFLLLKYALCLGVDFHAGINYEYLMEPTADHGWRAKVTPSIPEIEEFEFDVLVDASGRRNSVYEIDAPSKIQSLENKRAVRTMIAVAATFVNSGRMDERYPQVSSLAARVNEDFSDSDNYAIKLQRKGYDVETIIYYRRETHYFIFTAKKSSLKAKNLIKKEYDSIKQSLARDNINRENLKNYAMDVANELIHLVMSPQDTQKKAPCRFRQYHIDENGEADVDIFDFEALSSATNSSKILERKGKMLFLSLVGDGLTSLLGTKEYLYSHLRYMDKKPKQFPANRFDCLDPWYRYTRSCDIKKNYAQTINLYDTDLDAGSKGLEDVALYEPARDLYCRNKNYGAGVILSWCNELLSMFQLDVVDFSSSWRSGIALLAVISIWSPSLIDWLCVSSDDQKNVQRAINILAIRCGIPPPLTAYEIAHLTVKDEDVMVDYLNSFLKFLTTNYDYLILEGSSWSIFTNDVLKRPGQCFPSAEKVIDSLGNEAVENIRRRMIGKGGGSRIMDKDENENEVKVGKERSDRESAISKDESTMTDRLNNASVKSEAVEVNNLPGAKVNEFERQRCDSFPDIHVGGTNGDYCAVCSKLVYNAVKVVIPPNNEVVHKLCFRCVECHRNLTGQEYMWNRSNNCFYCEYHRPTQTTTEVEKKNLKEEEDGTLTVLDLSRFNDEVTGDSNYVTCPEIQLTREQWRNPIVHQMLVNNAEVRKAILQVLDKQPFLKMAILNAVATPAIIEAPKRVIEHTKIIEYSCSTCRNRLDTKMSEQVVPNSFVTNTNKTILKDMSNVKMSDFNLHRVKSFPTLTKKKSVDICHVCKKRVWSPSSTTVYGHMFHSLCFKCSKCDAKLTSKTFYYDQITQNFFCVAHGGTVVERVEASSSKSVTLAGLATPPRPSQLPDCHRLARSAKKLTNIFKIKK